MNYLPMKAMNMATPLPSQIPMTPEQMQAYRWEKEIDWMAL